MQMRLFMAMYSAKFRPLTDADGIQEWQREIGPDDIDEKIMRQALEAIDDHHRRLSEDNGRTVAAPRIGEVMAAYRRAVDNQVHASRVDEQDQEPPKTFVLVDRDTLAFVDLDKPRSTYNGPIILVASGSPCPPSPLFDSRDAAVKALRDYEKGAAA